MAASVEKYQEVIAKLRASIDNEFDFVAFPISKTIKSSGQGDLREIVGALMPDEASPG